jgi:hypothetical protein
MSMIDVGHTAVMIPMAGAIVAWLLTEGRWRLAFYWCSLFAFGLSVVALSKIAFLGWGIEMQSIGFKALSGHAFRSTVVIPVFLYVAQQNTSEHWRVTGFLFGIALSMVLSILLINFNFHTTSEVIVTFIFGVVIAAAFIGVARRLPQARTRRWTVPMSLITFFVIHNLKPSLINHRLVDIALYLSGRDYPYRW